MAVIRLVLLLPQLTNASGWRWIHPWFDPRKGCCCHTLSVPLFIAHSHSYSNPETPPCSLPHFRPMPLLIFFLLSPFLYSSTYHCQSSQSVSSLSFSFPLYFFWSLLSSFPVAHYLLHLPCPLCAFTPSVSSFALLMQAQFSLSVPFPHQCFLFLLLFRYFYSITLLTLPVSWPAPSLITPPIPLSEQGVQAAPEWQGDIVCHISIPRQSPFSPESNYFFQSERFNLL